MNENEAQSDEYAAELRSAVDAGASSEADWESFHSRLNAAAASALAALRQTAAPGAAWWDYTARAGLAAVPFALAAAVLLFAYLREGNSASAPESRVAIAGTDAVRDAFDSVLTGSAAPKAVINALLPAPPASFLGDSSGGGGR